MGYFSEVARRRIAAVILIVGIVLAVLAITDTAFFEDPPTEAEKVETASWSSSMRLPRGTSKATASF